LGVRRKSWERGVNPGLLGEDVENRFRKGAPGGRSPPTKKEKAKGMFKLGEQGKRARWGEHQEGSEKKTFWGGGRGGESKKRNNNGGEK